MCVCVSVCVCVCLIWACVLIQDRRLAAKCKSAGWAEAVESERCAEKQSEAGHRLTSCGSGRQQRFLVCEDETCGPQVPGAAVQWHTCCSCM